MEVAKTHEESWLVPIVGAALLTAGALVFTIWFCNTMVDIAIKSGVTRIATPH